MLNIFKSSLLVSIFVLGVGCSWFVEEREPLVQAKAYIDSGENNAAIIVLKDLLKTNPKSVDARLLLGGIYFDFGLYDAAIKEFNFSLKLGADVSRLDPKVFQSLYLLERYEELLDVAMLYDNQNATSSAQFYKALTFIRMDDNQSAVNNFKKAQSGTGNDKFKRLSDIYLQIDNGEIQAATQSLEKLLKQFPRFPEALLLKGQLAYAEGQYLPAAATIKMYNETRKNDIRSKFMLADSYIKLKDWKNASYVVDGLLSSYPEAGLANYYRGQIYYLQKDFNQAKSFIEKAIQNGVDNDRVRLIAAYINFHLENYELALSHFKKVQNNLSADDPTHRIIAATYFLVGEYESATDAIESLETIPDHDISYLSSATIELFKQGKNKEAKRVLKQVKGIETENPFGLLRIGILKGALTDESGLQEIMLALEKQADLPGGQLALISALIMENKFEEALLQNEKLTSDPKTKLQGLNIAGQIYLKLGNEKKAESVFKEALDLDSSNLTSLVFLMTKELANQNYQAAIPYLNKALERQEPYLPALELYYSTFKKAGRTEDGIRNLTKLAEHHQSIPEFQISIARALFAERRFEEALSKISELQIENVSENDSYWQLTNEINYSLQRFETVRQLFAQWTNYRPLNKQAWLSWAAFHERFGQFSSALTVIEDAKQHIRGDEKLELVHAYYLIQNNQIERAEVILSNMSESAMSTVFAKGLTGLIYAHQRKYDEALPLLLEQYNELKADKSAARLFMIYMSNKQPNQAIEFMNGHLQHSPNFENGYNLLASYWMKNDQQKAIEAYKKILQLNSKHIVALNNLAWLFKENNELERADKYISQALSIAPNNPIILDTAGLIEVSKGNKETAIQFFEKAKKIDPSNTQINKHYQQAINM